MIFKTCQKNCLSKQANSSFVNGFSGRSRNGSLNLVPTSLLCPESPLTQKGHPGLRSSQLERMRHPSDNYFIWIFLHSGSEDFIPFSFNRASLSTKYETGKNTLFTTSPYFLCIGGKRGFSSMDKNMITLFRFWDLPFNSLESTTCEVYQSSGRTSQNANNTFAKAFEEASCPCLFSTYKRDRKTERVKKITKTKQSSLVT